MLVGTVIADRFRIDQLAGRGGMGAVYRARDLARDVDVAVKVGHVAGHDQARRMAREAQALHEHLRALRHADIVEYVAHGVTADERVYLVMEWLEGHDLAARLAQGPLAEADVIALAWRLARTLSLVHGCGVVHRDIKPGNVFLVQGDLARVKLIDFGLVFLGADASRMTPSGVYLGTPGFMAPEQIQESRIVDGRADLYALGVLMFACLTRRLPFQGEHLASVLARVLFEEAPRVREVRAEVSLELDELIARLLAKSPGERPESADALAAALEHLRDPASAGGVPSLRAPMAVSHGEQRFFTVLQAGPMARDSVEAATRVLVSLFADQQGEIVPLADRTLLAMFTGGTLEDTAAQAARCALSLRASGLAAPMVLATGRGSMSMRSPVGEVVERAAALRFRPIEDAGHEANLPLDSTDRLGASWDDAETLPPAITVPMAEIPESAILPAILIDELTARLIEGRFAIEPHASHGFLLQGELSGAGVGRMQARPLGPCLGRERELARIAMVLDECIESSAPRAVLVGGPPGMGKSRLAEEFVHRLGARAQVWRAGGARERAGSALGLLARLILHTAGALHTASPAEQRAMLADRVRARVVAEDAARVVIFLSEIAGLPQAGEDDLQLREARRDARLMHDQMLRAWEDSLDAEAAAGPLVLVLDDLQWADAPSLRFIERGLCHLVERPIFALGLARPELDDVFPDLWSACHSDRMLLRPLSGQVATTLAQHHAARALSADVLARVLERADGNPFYIEELVRHATGGDSERLPDTLLALVAMRLTELPADERRVLRAASVFGRHFWPGGVAALLGEDTQTSVAVSPVIDRLIARNLVLPERQTPRTGEPAYRFRHDLVGDAAYAMLLEDDLVRAHRQAAVWLEQAGERDAFVLAEHYRRGRAPAQALPWYCRAAEQALAADDVQAVLRPVEHAVACGASGVTLGALRLLKAEAQNWGSQHEAAYHAASAAMALLPHGSDAWAHAAHQLSWAAVTMGDVDAALRVAEQLAGLSDPLTDVMAVAMAHCATHLIISGQRADAGALVDRLDARAQAHVPSVAGAILHLRAFRAVWLGGRMDLATLWFGRAVEQWELAGNMRQACLDRINLGTTLRLLGQYEDGVAALRRSLDQGRRLGVEHLVSTSASELALSLGRLGQLDEALELVRGPLPPSLRERMYRGITHAWLALLGARPADALAELDRSVLGTDEPRIGDLMTEAMAMRAVALLDLRRPHEALEAARASMDIVDAARVIQDGEALLRLVHAEALYATGDHERGRQAMSEAYTWLCRQAEQIENPAWRQSFLDRVAEHRRIAELARAWGIDHAERSGSE
jgi:tetratricopeptide (TPR) repeat protein